MWRIWALFFFFISLFFLIVLRLLYWQILVGEKLGREAAAQHFLTLNIPAVRGEIVASDGAPLAMNKPAYLVYASPREVTQKELFAQTVATKLGLERTALLEQLRLPDRVWVPLGHKVDTTLTEELKQLNLPGLGFEKEPKRYYPESSMAAHLLGFVGSDQNGNDKGYFGLEGYYDRELRGKDGLIELEKDVRGAPILVGESKRIAPDDGRKLTLWLDRSIQKSVERRLQAGIEKYGAKEGAVVVMDPTTGGILAMAAYPGYEPEQYEKYDKVVYKNPLVGSSYEPGSTFKTLVMSAGLEEHAVTPTTTMDESGPVQVSDYSIRTWNNEYHGMITMTQVLERSSNVGMVFVQKKLGKDKLLQYIHDFGFGRPSGVDLEDESIPTMRASDQWRDIDLATASFGQGIAVTPLQMIRAVAALANDGWLMEPHVVKQVEDERGGVVVIKPKRIKRVVSAQTAKVITEMMIAAVDHGEAQWAKPKGYRIAGKTGTAQIPVAGHYDDKKTIASFVGFAPADNPKFVMLTILREPTSSPWGSETAAPLFFTIARDIFSYYGISPQ